MRTKGKAPYAARKGSLARTADDLLRWAAYLAFIVGSVVLGAWLLGPEWLKGVGGGIFGAIAVLGIFYRGRERAGRPKAV
jgi:hypothetical protein